MNKPFTLHRFKLNDSEFTLVHSSETKFEVYDLDQDGPNECILEANESAYCSNGYFYLYSPKGKWGDIQLEDGQWTLYEGDIRTRVKTGFTGLIDALVFATQYYVNQN